jgi:hypothetical protein
VNPFPPQGSATSTSFVGAVAGRFTRRSLLYALALAATSLAFHSAMARYFDYATDTWASFMWGGAVISTTMGITSVLAILCADEASRRGWSPTVAYASSLLMASAVSGVLQWYLRVWFGLTVIADGDPSDAIRMANMVYMSLDTLVWGGVVMVGYTQWQHESRCLRQVEALHLDRLRIEQQLARSRLSATLAQVEPEVLLGMLKRIKRSYETASSDAEPLLDELIAHLRDRQNAANAGFQFRDIGVRA